MTGENGFLVFLARCSLFWRQANEQSGSGQVLVAAQPHEFNFQRIVGSTGSSFSSVRRWTPRPHAEIDNDIAAHQAGAVVVAARSTTSPTRPAGLVRTDVRKRSEEHTSELQSLRHLVCRLLLEKKKNK